MPLENEGVVTEGGMPSTPASETEESISAVNWEDYAGDDEEGSVEGDLVVAEPADGVPPPSGQPAASEPQAPQPTPPATPAPAATTPTAPESPSPAPQVSTPPSEPVVQPTVTPEELATRQAEQLASLEKLYTLSSEDAEALQTEPELVLPKLAARLHQEVLANAMQAVVAQLPAVVQSLQRTETVESQAKKFFFETNPDLNESHIPAIQHVGAMFRKVNPQATPAEAAKKIGELVRVSLGLPAYAPAPQGAGAPAPATPQTPAPFTPARGGSGGAGGRPASADNPFTQLAEEFLAEG